MFHNSSIEISKSAYQTNIQFMRDYLGDTTKFSSVVKGNAYGHGFSPFVSMAMECGVEHFSVFSADEAAQVVPLVPEGTPIMIMGMLDAPQLAWAIEQDVEFYVFDSGRLEDAIRLAQKIGKPAKIHLELETGMNRTGFAEAEMEEVMHLLIRHKSHVHLFGLCTHYAGAESITNHFRIAEQKAQFSKMSKKLKQAGLVPNRYHTACSAAALRYPDTQMDLVRMGILQYGFFPTQEVLIDFMLKHGREDYPLRRLLTWKTKVMDVKSVKKGQYIGYGTSYIANHDMRIATIPVGYSHGFSRSLSNQGRVLLHGKRVPIVGTINMNMMSVDVSQLTGVEKGDEVVMIGRQGDMEISVSSFSEFSEQINYELLTRLPANIPRTVVF